MIKLITLTKKLHWPEVFRRDASSFLAFNIPCKEQSFPKLSIKAWNNNKKKQEIRAISLDSTTSQTRASPTQVTYITIPKTHHYPKSGSRSVKLQDPEINILPALKEIRKSKIYWYKTVGLSEEV